MLRQRLITGPLLIAFIVGVVWLDERLASTALSGGWSTLFEWLGWQGDRAPRGLVLFAVALFTVPLMAREAGRMLEESGVANSLLLDMGAAALAFIVVALLPACRDPAEAAAVAATLLVAIVVAGIIRFSRGHTVRGVLAASGGLLLVAVYAGVLLAFWLLIRREHSAWVLVGAVLTIKSCDIAAYFTGVSIGRHKLIPWLSPGKTWEGLIGGVLGAAAVGGLLAGLSSGLPSPADHVPWWGGAIGGVVLGLVGQFGDLTESLFKRDAGRKDSGRLLPGMGGVLDVLDSPLMAGPVAFWLLRLLTGGDSVPIRG